MKKPSITKHPDAIVGKRHNRRMVVTPTEDGENVLIQLTILDGETKPRASHTLSHNDKAVVTGILISKSGIEMLYTSLKILLNDYEEIAKNSKLNIKPNERSKTKTKRR